MRSRNLTTESGHETAESSLRFSIPVPPSGYARGIERKQLTWRWEDGYEAGEPLIGPAWLTIYDENDTKIAEEKLFDGEWVTRADAIRHAEKNGYELLLDE